VKDLIEKMALDPLTGRVACFALVGTAPRKEHELPQSEETEYVEVIPKVDDDSEREVIQSIFRVIGTEETRGSAIAAGNKDARIVTFNGIGFDLPFVYKRSVILGVDPGSFGAPPLHTWTKKYSTDRHFDLARIWYGWGPVRKGEDLERLCKLILHEHRADIPYAEMLTLLKTEEGRKAIGEGCLSHTRLTWRLWKKFNGVMFA
jgi:DNA polymerase elongation subunit (family B)